MALQFDPTPYLEAYRQRQARRPDWNQMVNQPIQMGLNTLVQMQQQKKLDDQRAIENQRAQETLDMLKKEKFGYDVPGQRLNLGQLDAMENGGQNPVSSFMQPNSNAPVYPPRQLPMGGMNEALQGPQNAPAPIISPVSLPAQFDSWMKQRRSTRVPGSMELASNRQAMESEDQRLRREQLSEDRAYRRQIDQERLDIQRQGLGLRGEANEEKKRAAKEKEDIIMGSLKDRANLIIGKVDQALGKVNSLTTGGMSGLAGVPFIGQATGATDLSSDLDTIKAILGFEQLEQMKNQSRAGASGLGQLSDREMRLLTAARSNLEQQQTPEQLKARLMEVKTHFQNWLKMEQGINPYQQGGDGTNNDPLGIR